MDEFVPRYLFFNTSSKVFDLNFMNGADIFFYFAFNCLHLRALAY